MRQFLLPMSSTLQRLDARQDSDLSGPNPKLTEFRHYKAILLNNLAPIYPNEQDLLSIMERL
jgi:hypothetical protein